MKLLLWEYLKSLIKYSFGISYNLVLILFNYNYRLFNFSTLFFENIF